MDKEARIIYRHVTIEEYLEAEKQRMLALFAGKPAATSISVPCDEALVTYVVKRPDGI